MDACCGATLKTYTPAHSVRANTTNGGGLLNAFWGERVKGGSNGRFWSEKLERSLRARRRSKSRVGVAVSVLTSDIDEKTFIHQEMPVFPREKADPKKVVSIILGGGAGTRLFPSLADEPSLLLIDVPMSNCINSGINKIFILTQFNSASLNRHIARTYNFGNGVNFGDGFVEVLAATQTPGEAGMNWFQGTADAVRQFFWVFEDAKNKNVEHIVILSGDHLYRMDYMDFVQKHIDTNADITVSCIPMDDRVLVGALQQVDTTVLGLSPMEAKRFPYIASMGVYVFRTDVLVKLLKWRYPTSNDFGSEIIPAAVMDQNVQAYLFNDYWEDIGTIKSFFDANLALTEQVLNAIISHGCFLRECSIEHSIVGVRSRLEYGVDLKDTMMMGADYYQTESEIASLLADGKVPIGVGRNTLIRNCIIDKNAKIGKDVSITNKDGVQEADRSKEGFYIRTGITVILKNATIPDGTVI
ncbi:hypothetical protein Scep_000676 [Stephania cephalantha]|uniref:glucose-1-phosphate adenylyltransferase n=1 Tax=Stephania cephalantha TaxID=152367 RepID=A0AAP0L7K2_9MAGN